MILFRGGVQYNNKVGIKLSEAILSILGIAGKNISVSHSQQDCWKSSQPARCIYNLQPDSLEGFPADVRANITGQFGCGCRVYFAISIKSKDLILWPWFVSFCIHNWVIFPQTNIMELDFFGTTNADRLSPTFTRLFQRFPAQKDTMLKTLTKY